MTKSQQTESVKNIVCGNNDSSGNKIVHVLATGNEYAIYEIDHPDINNRLRVLIDGNTDESEKVLLEKFSQVKQKYIEAKGLLYRSSNFGMMKNRVAHALATSLSSDKIDGNAEFEKLISAIKKESDDTIINRAVYLIPCVLITVIMAIIALCNMELRISSSPFWQIIMVLLASSLGGSMSILYNVKKLHFEEYGNLLLYLQFGVERIFLAIVAGSIAFILIKAKFLLPEVVGSNYWGVMTILVVAAFSESMIPSALGRIEDKTKNQ